jgi:chromosome partitioning protein
VDLDVLGTVDRASLTVTGTSHYSQMVEEALLQRRLSGKTDTDWIILRNRLSMLGSRNTRSVAEGLEELSKKLDFRLVDGLAERVIFREFYPRGLTALDTLDEATLGTRLTGSHVAARIEIDNLLEAVRLHGAVASDQALGESRDAA